ncbi:MAG: divalent-cation tolerance protein CutA [Endomicrobiaceae bacterium]|jgi:periplasmic divalent cation tolerance protein|nr:divalent-cation tolerance protein CutA [Endomicrobiaceae bacterium]
MQYITVVITSPDKEASKKITDCLLKNKLVSCVSIIPAIKSVYWWNNKINRAKEQMLICKSKKTNFKKITDAVKKNHPYKVPEIVCFEIKDGSKDYLEWIKNTVL